MNLYYGGCGNYQEFVVADSEADAIAKLGIKINAAFLPITAEVIDNIDGFSILPMEQTQITDQELTTIINSLADDKPELRHCKKCDFTCENQGEMMQHYRSEHPKNEGA